MMETQYILCLDLGSQTVNTVNIMSSTKSKMSFSNDIEMPFTDSPIGSIKRSGTQFNLEANLNSKRKETNQILLTSSVDYHIFND